MPISAENLSDEIVQRMRRYNRDVLTVRWSDFYKLCERDRLKKGFIDALVGHLAEASVLFVQGSSAVAFVKDYDFAPYYDVHEVKGQA